jgi:hypothetical protein
VSDQARFAARSGKQSLPEMASELWSLVVTYLQQETVNPIKGLGRFVAFGLAGSLMLGTGLLLLVLAGLRALQEEAGSTFDGNWSWAPYGITLVACALVAGLAARAIGATRRRVAKRGAVG